MMPATQEFKSIRVEQAGNRVQIVNANGVLSMTPNEAHALALALDDAAEEPRFEGIELWSEGTISEKVVDCMNPLALEIIRLMRAQFPKRTKHWFKSIRVEQAGDRVRIVIANGVLSMTPNEAHALALALDDAAEEPRFEGIELWSDGTIGEKVEA